MASKSRNKGLKALAVQFAAVTGASEETGLQLLDVCNGNLEMAIGMHLEGGADGAQASGSNSANTDGASGSSAAPMINDDDNVRAPIPQKQEVLVPDVPAFGPRPRTRRGRNSVFDKFRDFEAETRQQEEMIRRGESNRSLVGKKRTLEDLFRPPLDIMHKGTLNTARDQGQAQCKWVIVNVQNVQEFRCQQLNRDVWSDSTVKSIINESFVFWQVYHDSDEGKRFMQYYKVLDFPYVAVLDPRTGEQMASWNRLDNMSFCDLAMQFLCDHPMFDSEGLSPPHKRVKTQTSIIDASEDSQLEAAIAASLAEPSSSSNSKQNTFPAIPTTSSSIPSSKRKIISISDDEDSDTFHSVNGSSSDEDSDDGGGDVKVLDTVKNKNNEKQNSGKAQEKRTMGGSKSTKVSKDQGDSKSSETVDEGDEETGERTCKKTNSVEKTNDSKGESSNVKEAVKKTNDSKGQSSKVKEAVKKTTDSKGQSSNAKEVADESEAAKPGTSSQHKGQSSNVKEVADGSEAAKPGTSCQQNGAAAPEEGAPSRTDEESEVASEADAIDPSNACNLMLRFPDGRRKQVTLQATDSLLTLVRHVNREGFASERYELVTTFPRRRLSYLDIDTNLKAAGLFPQETIFIQER